MKSISNSMRGILLMIVLVLTLGVLTGCTDARLQFTVRFKCNGGSSINSIEVRENDKIIEPIAPTKDGYNFDGWFKTVKCTDEWNFEKDIVTAEINLYAKWTKNEGTPGLKYTLNQYGNATYDITGYDGVSEHVVIPSLHNSLPITAIGDHAFEGNPNIIKVTIPDSVRIIGDYAFAGCLKLTDISIPNSVTTIDSNAFALCSALVNVSIPSSVRTINEKAFYKCESMRNVLIATNGELTFIGDFAFYYCSELIKINIPAPVTYVGSHALAGCLKLTIYAKASTNRNGWIHTWNYSKRPVKWD